MAYTKTLWVDDQAPAIDAINLNHIENGIYNADKAITDIVTGVTTVSKATTAVTAGTLTNPPVVVPVGGIIMWSTSTSIPANFYECNGQTLPRTNALWQVIGTTFGGGDGFSTFNLPDLRAMFVRGWDHGKGIDTGRVFGSTQEDQFESHTHNVHLNLNTLTGSILGVTQGQCSGADGLDTTSSATGWSETRPINVALVYLIKGK